MAVWGAWGWGVVAFGTVGGGFRRGSVRGGEQYTARDSRQYDPRFYGENFDANMNAVEIVRNIAEAIGAKPSQVAIAWLLGKGDFIVPIPGTKRRASLEENPDAVDVRLTDDNMPRFKT